MFEWAVFDVSVRVIGALPASPVLPLYTFEAKGAHNPFPRDSEEAGFRISFVKGGQQVWDEAVLRLDLRVWLQTAAQEVRVEGKIIRDSNRASVPKVRAAWIQAYPAFIVDTLARL